MLIGESRIVWSTPGGGTGYSVFHTVAPTTVGEADFINVSLRAFVDAILGQLPNEVTLSSYTELRVLDDATGNLVSTFPITTGWTRTGTNAGGYNRAAGARVDWTTGSIVAGRRLRGRTYLVPLAAANFDSNGLLTASVVTLIGNAAAALRTALSGSTQILVWSRAHGTSRPVTGHSVPPAGAILRGRRD